MDGKKLKTMRRAEHLQREDEEEYEEGEKE